MIAPIVTIAQYFLLQRSLHKEAELKALEESKGMCAVRDNLAALPVPRVMAGFAKNSALQGLSEELNVTPGNVVCWAWNTRRTLRKYCDPVAYPPSKGVEHHVDDHDVTWECFPKLEIFLDAVSLGTVNFTVTMKLRVTGVKLQIQGGRIMSVELATCRGEGTVLCEKAVLFDPKTKEFSVAEPFFLGEGIPIKAPPAVA